MLKIRSWLITNALPESSSSCNKDLNGGYRTWDKIGNNLISKIIAKSKHIVSNYLGKKIDLSLAEEDR